MHPAPDILHGSYLISEQSPASSHNTPVLSHTRSFNIPIYRPYVKKKFSISAKIFGIFFVQVYEINFGGNNPLKLPRCSLIRALLHMFFDRLKDLVSFETRSFKFIIPIV